MPVNGATISFEGTATAPDYFVIYNVVQEQIGPAGLNESYWQFPSWFGNFTTGDDWTTPSSANFRFTIWSVLPDGAQQIYADCGDSFDNPELGFQDCQFYGGVVTTLAPGMQVTNCLFHRVVTYVSDFDVTLPATNVFFNNLFVGGEIGIDHEDGGIWTIEDNLLDQVIVVVQDGNTADVCDYNGYVTNCSTLTTPVAAHDVILTNSPAYEIGTLGKYYYLTNLPLIHAGSRSAPDAGLYHYTVTTNNAVEGTNRVSIGFHYVACTNGLPLDSNGDGIPDYLEDANGNGLVDSGEIAWNVAGDLGLTVWITQPANNSKLP